MALTICLEVEAEERDHDLILGRQDRHSITISPRSYFQEVTLENDRRYPALDEVTYHMPNDNIEAARPALQHNGEVTTFDGGFCHMRLQTRPRLCWM